MPKLNQKILYIIAGLAFLFALLKYSFVQDVISGYFVSVEAISFIFFLFVIYLSDKSLQFHKQKEVNDAINIQKSNAAYEKKIALLKEQVNSFKNTDALDGNITVSNIITDLNDITPNSKDIESLTLRVLSHHFDLGVGVYYKTEQPSGNFTVKATYGLSDEIIINDFIEGDGLNGQAALDKKPMCLDDIDDDYFNVESGLGESKPKYLAILPVVKENKTIGLFELASFTKIDVEQYWTRINEALINSKILNS